MKYCSNCVMPDTKPGVVLDERGYCNACRSKEVKASIDWEQRGRDLDAIVEEIKAQNHPFYDCIVLPLYYHQDPLLAHPQDNKT